MADTQQSISHWSIGRGRGIRPAKPYTPSRRPGQPATASSSNTANQQTNPTTDNVKSLTANLSKCSVDQNTSAPKGNGNSQSSGNGNGAKSGANGQPSSSGMKSGVTTLKAKYSYKANPDSPLGQKELALKQGEVLVFVGVCEDNEMWWKVAREQGGEDGFVPASYVEVWTEKVTQLPWLAAKQSAEDQELPKVKPVWKPYKSAYDKEGNVSQGGGGGGSSTLAAHMDQWYCKWCDKQLNGPKPYGAHITSKAHKEEVELAKENGEYTED